MPTMIDLFNSDTNAMIGSITENELKTLQDALEEESADDHDYFIDPATIDLLADGRATEHLLHLLRTAVGSGEGIEIRWQRRHYARLVLFGDVSIRLHECREHAAASRLELRGRLQLIVFGVEDPQHLQADLLCQLRRRRHTRAFANQRDVDRHAGGN